MANSLPEFSPNGETQRQQPELREEPMLTRYSPHHEFSVSAIVSVVAHGLLGILAFLAGAYVFSWANDRPVVPVGNLVITENAGGGGSGLGGGQPATPRELGVARPDFDGPFPSRDAARLDDLPPIDVVELAKAEQAAGKNAHARGGDVGRSGPGRRGGSGPGDGPGDGPGTEAGVGRAKPTLRALRMERWVLGIKYENGADFLKKLANLQAIVAIPEGNAQYRVFSDLHQKPIPSAQQTAVDLGKLGRIYWSQHDAGALAELARELGLSSPPNRAYMFFPRSLEDEMLRVELAHAKLTEDEINRRGLETKFQAERRGDKWIVTVLEQKPRSR